MVVISQSYSRINSLFTTVFISQYELEYMITYESRQFSNNICNWQSKLMLFIIILPAPLLLVLQLLVVLISVLSYKRSINIILGL